MKFVDVEGIIIPNPESYKDCIELIRSDYFRVFGRRISSTLKLWLLHFKSPSLGFLFYYRLCKYRGIFWPYLRLRMEKYKRKYAFQIPLAARIGYGLYLGHDTGVIINGSAVIGNNVNLSQFTTIGSLKSNAATIEDEVYIGPSVCIVEDIRIGKRAMIGAGAVVTHDIPAGSSAAGVPARVVNPDADYSPRNAYPLPQIQ